MAIEAEIGHAMQVKDPSAVIKGPIRLRLRPPAVSVDAGGVHDVANTS
jgi:hypothetical protein